MSVLETFILAGRATSLATLAAPLALGVLLGGIFFGGLWWTVRHGLTSSNPGLWFGVSALARMGIVLMGFYFVAHAGVWSVLACLLGVLAARTSVTRLARAAG